MICKKLYGILKYRLVNNEAVIRSYFFWVYIMKVRRKKGFFSISAVAKMFSVHQQTVRLYEKQGLINPKGADWGKLAKKSIRLLLG